MPRAVTKLEHIIVSFLCGFGVATATNGCGAPAFGLADQVPEVASAEQTIEAGPPDASEASATAAPSKDDGATDVADVAVGVADARPNVIEASLAPVLDAEAEPDGPYGYTLEAVIPSSANPAPPQDARQGTCCIPETLVPPAGQAACAEVYCQFNCVPIVCSTCPVISAGSYTEVCPPP